MASIFSKTHPQVKTDQFTRKPWQMLWIALPKDSRLTQPLGTGQDGITRKRLLNPAKTYTEGAGLTVEIVRRRKRPITGNGAGILNVQATRMIFSARLLRGASTDRFSLNSTPLVLHGGAIAGLTDKPITDTEESRR